MEQLGSRGATLAGPVAVLGGKGRWSARRRMAIVLELLHGAEKATYDCTKDHKMILCAYDIQITPTTCQGLYQFPCRFRALSLPVERRSEGAWRVRRRHQARPEPAHQAGNDCTACKGLLRDRAAGIPCSGMPGGRSVYSGADGAGKPTLLCRAAIGSPISRRSPSPATGIPGTPRKVAPTHFLRPGAREVHRPQAPSAGCGSVLQNSPRSDPRFDAGGDGCGSRGLLRPRWRTRSGSDCPFGTCGANRPPETADGCAKRSHHLGTKAWISS